jgi:hypothetical protein
MRFIDILAYVGLPLMALCFVLFIVVAVRRMQFERRWYRREPPGGYVIGLCQYLQTLGINASVLEEKRYRSVSGQPCGLLEMVKGIIKLEGRVFDSVNIVLDTQNSWLCLDYIMNTSSLYARDKGGRIRLIMKRKSMDALFSTFLFTRSDRVIDIEWRGEAELARELNFDSQLRNKLLKTDLEPLCETLDIVPEPKYGCIKIRTSYFLPTPEQFDILESVAKHIKSG